MLDDGSAQGHLITSFQSFGGASVTKLIPHADVPGLKAAELLFRVTPQEGQLDDGAYTLEFRVSTSNPHPFEVIERYWGLDDDGRLGLLDHPEDEPVDDTLFGTHVGTVVDIVQNQFGHGTAVGAFNHSTPSTLGSADVYRFKAIGPGRLTVHTEKIGDKINTNLKLYRRKTTPDGTPYLAPVTAPAFSPDVFGNPTDDELLVNFDWYPANRDEIDAQSYMHDESDSTVPDTEWYYVVVKNQEGTQAPTALSWTRRRSS